jgi:hypothetical protein
MSATYVTWYGSFACEPTSGPSGTSPAEVHERLFAAAGHVEPPMMVIAPRCRPWGSSPESRQPAPTNLGRRMAGPLGLNLATSVRLGDEIVGDLDNDAYASPATRIAASTAEGGQLERGRALSRCQGHVTRRRAGDPVARSYGRQGTAFRDRCRRLAW